jgi:tetratricopeptide (TPR) repeat protein
LGLARFIFWTGIKALGLLFLGLLAAKAVGALPASVYSSTRRIHLAVRGVLYVVILALVGAGAQTIGYDLAAEVYMHASASDLIEREKDRAYLNARRAVGLRPGTLRYWQGLSNAKFSRQQYASVIADLPVLVALGGGRLEEADAHRLAASYYFLGQYDKVHPLAQAMIRENPVYAAAYVLEGYTYLAEKKYDESVKIFLEVLQLFPSHQAAVEGLAHAHYLSGNRAAAISVLEQTAQFRFPAGSRQRFEALKELYAQ